MQIVLNDKQFDATQSLSTKDVYFRLCACLDREIELVWKRAVFLTAFLIAAFAGYGGLIAAYIGIGNPRTGTFAEISIASICISFVGMALSVIWIMMAKGSKAWQEHFEKVIECFVETRIHQVSEKNNDDLVLNIFASGNYLKTVKGVSLRDFDLTKKPITGCFLDCHGGAFSVSKIVIALGRLFFLCWTGIAIVHSLYLCFHHNLAVVVLGRFFGICPNWLANCSKCAVILAPILLVVIFLFL